MFRLKTKFYLFVNALIAAYLFSQPLSCAPKGNSLPADGIYHIVKPGQTLYRIALTYEVPVKSLSEVNDIKDPAQIKIGQKILIPGALETVEVPIYHPTPLKGFEYLPVSGLITSGFGARRGNSTHTGVDISTRNGEAVHVVLPGTVIFAGNQGDYGRTIKIQHDNGYISLYAHNSRLFVRKGQKVKKGQKIASVGRSGNATGYHLHFEILKNGTPVNPLDFLDK